MVGSETDWKHSESQLELGEELWNVTYTSLKVGTDPPHFWTNSG